MTKDQQMSQADKAAAKRRKKIRTENNRLMSLFEQANPNQLDFIRDQVQQLAFYNVSIAELQEKINKFGTLVTYDNGGGQSGIRTNPDVKTLTDYQKLSNAIVKNLLPLLPAQGESGFMSSLIDKLSEYGAG